MCTSSLEKRTSGSPDRTRGALWARAAGWWVADYAFVAAWQVRAAFNASDPWTFQSGAKAPVVVLPGVYESWKFLEPLVAKLHSQGHPVHVMPKLKMNLRHVPESAAIVTRHLELHDLHGVIIVAHSKGGLIGKQVMVQPEGIRRVKGMVAIATPFGGSMYARYMLARSLRIFSPHDETIRALAQDEQVNSRIVSIYGSFDPHIPARSALHGARNVELTTGGHFRILARPEVLEEVERLAGSAATAE
ncbi:MAG: alpha/beta hydrolase [Demequina sp.]